MLSESLLFKIILFLYFKIFFILKYFNDSILIKQKSIIFYQNKQKIEETLPKWLFWTSINIECFFI